LTPPAAAQPGEASPGAGAAPLAIGGVGGSGTRLVAELAGALGLAMGPDRNLSEDNLWYTLLFKQPGFTGQDTEAFSARAAIFVAAMTRSRTLSPGECRRVRELARADRPQHPADWLQLRAASLLEAAGTAGPVPARWGWKEPNTHVLLPQWQAGLPGLRYVHVVRNGLDMALSSNQNQLEYWGEWLLERPVQAGPRDSLAYWCAVHRRVARLGERMPGRFLWLDYDRLCQQPAAGLTALADFLGVPVDSALALADRVKPPASIGRHQGAALSQFRDEDLDYLRSLGHIA